MLFVIRNSCISFWHQVTLKVTTIEKISAMPTLDQETELKLWCAKQKEASSRILLFDDQSKAITKPIWNCFYCRAWWMSTRSRTQIRKIDRKHSVYNRDRPKKTPWAQRNVGPYEISLELLKEISIWLYRRMLNCHTTSKLLVCISHVVNTSQRKLKLTISQETYYPG